MLISCRWFVKKAPSDESQANLEIGVKGRKDNFEGTESTRDRLANRNCRNFNRLALPSYFHG